MKSSKLMTVSGLVLKVETEDKPPTLCPLHKHTVKAVSAIEDLAKRHTTRQELSVRMRKTELFPAMSGDML